MCFYFWQVTDNGWQLSQLLLLFRFCHICKADNPLIKTKWLVPKLLLLPYAATLPAVRK